MWFIIDSISPSRVGGGFRNDDLNLRHPLRKRYVVVPTRHDRDTRGPASHRQFTLPTSNVVPCAGETLPSTAITKTADAANHRFLECRRVVPTRTGQMPRRALERFSKSQTGIAHRDNDDAPAQAFRPAI